MRPVIYSKTPTKRFEMNWIMFRPNSDRLRGISGFLVKTKMKAYTKQTVAMCCQVVARKSVAQSSGDIRQPPAPRYACGQDQKFLRKKVLLIKIIITPLSRPRLDLRECVTSMIFQDLLVFLLGGLGGRVPNWESNSDFFVFKYLFC